MKPERWKQVEKIYHAALEREPGRRDAFLDEACAGDEALRQDVESLLVHQEQAESFIETPALKVVAQGMVENRAQTWVGQQLGAYKILSLLGAGGMGEVYLAEDVRLGRTVAIKILPPEVSSNPDRKGRFLREARAASALKHPNVATIYEIGESDGVNFIAMEFVEGQTLAERVHVHGQSPPSPGLELSSLLGRGPRGNGQPLETGEILAIGIQVADALDEAHGKGIIHRDIKSANIMLTPRAQVKVLDFGLAKITGAERDAVTSDVSTLASTASGVVMGTVDYMSPEQVLGKDVDHRTDIFSLGVVLYEIATGCQPFLGKTSTAVFDAILHKPPASLLRLNPNLPVELERIITKALEKNHEERYQAARELLVDLKRLKRDTDSGQLGESPVMADALSRGPVRLLLRRKWVMALVGAALVAAGMLMLRPNLPPPKVLSITPITNDGRPKLPFLVTGGSRVYFLEHIGGRQVLAQVSTAGGETILIPTPFPNVHLADISPSRTELLVGSIVGTEPIVQFWIMPLPGGAPRPLGDIRALDAA